MMEHVITIDRFIPESYREALVRAVLMEKSIALPVNVRVSTPNGVAYIEIVEMNIGK